MYVFVWLHTPKSRNTHVHVNFVYERILHAYANLLRTAMCKNTYSVRETA